MRIREIVSFGFFGVCTTVINTLTYSALYHHLRVANVPATIAAWGLSVLAAFISNKLWVFDSKSFDRRTLVKEGSSFFGARLLTGLLDIAIMYVAVDRCYGNGMLWKLVSNGIVIVLNYAASKLYIFKKAEKKKPTE